MLKLTLAPRTALLSLGVVLGLLAALAPGVEARPISTRPGISPRRGSLQADDSEKASRIASAVAGLRFEGNHNLTNKQLAAIVFTRGPDWRFWRTNPEFSEPTLVGDMTRIESLYHLHGFYETRSTYTLQWDDAAESVEITIRVEEGPGVVLNRLSIDIPDDIDIPSEQFAGLRAVLPLVVGKPFSADRYGRAKQLLLDRLAEAAHPLARIEGGATVELKSHEAEVHWTVVPGPTVFFGDVAITGLYQVDPETARREIRVESGQRYSTSVLQSTRRGMQGQGLYSWVIVQSRPGGARQLDPDTEETESPDRLRQASSSTLDAGETEVWPVEIRVTERSPYTFDAGIGYSSDESLRASVGWRNVNFLGDARKLRLTGLYSGILSKFEAELVQPYFIDPRVSLIARGSLRRETEPAFTADRILASLGVTRPLTNHWRGRITYEFAWQDVLKTTLGAFVVLAEPEGVSRTATVELGFRRQTLDDLLTPSKGSWLDFVIAPSLREIGSDFDFVGFFVEARGFVPTSLGGVLAGRLRMGTLQPIRSTTAGQIPIVSRYFSGGSNTHRGFQYHRMPPVGTIFQNIGGTSLFESSVEWRFPIWRDFGGVVFVDAGLIDLDPWRFPLDQLFWAVGPGLRYDTIVGPLRFDYGVLINPPGGGAARHNFFISVGHTF